MSRLRELVEEVLGEACEFGGGWDRATFDERVGRVTAVAAAKQLFEVEQHQRQASLFEGFEVGSLWRNDGGADLQLCCSRCAPPWWHVWPYAGGGGGDAAALLTVVVETAQRHYREVHGA